MSDSLTHFISSQEFRLIPLSGKHGEGKFAIVDAGDYDRLAGYKWSICAGGYVGGKVVIGDTKKQVLIHRFIMNPPDDMDTDHRNGNSLDNRRQNLRVCPTIHNTWNRRKTKKSTSSRFAGVSFDKATGKWNANIGWKKRQINLGLYDDEVYAARVRDGAAIVLFGEFAPPRNVPDQEPIPYEHKEKRIPVSKYTGVSYCERSGKWAAYYCVDYKQIQIGYYLSEVDAARARDGALILAFGESAERQVPELEPIFQKPAEYYGLRSSRFKGVSLDKRYGKWTAGIMIGRKRKHIGNFATELEAAHAYDEFAKSLLGEKANLNF